MNHALDQDCADEIRVAAWRAMRFDDLHANPKDLARAVDDWTYRGSPGALEDLLCALTSTEDGATAADNLMLQHQAAIKVIERLVQEVVDAEEKRGEWISYE